LAVLTPISEDEARAFLRAYDVGDLVRLAGIAAGSVNSNFEIATTRGRYFLRVYEEQAREGATREAALLEHLAGMGVPTPAPLAMKDGARVGELAGKSSALFPWQGGTMRCQAGVTTDDARCVGAALAAIHRAGEGAGEGSREGGAERAGGSDGTRWGASRFQDAQLLERLGRIATAASPELAEQAAPLRAKLAQWSLRRDPALARGLIHGDLFRDNVLWDDGGRISGLLDFESASDGVFAYDLMVTALAWCVGDALDPALLRAMVSGYESVRPLTPAERAGLLAEGCAAAIRFTITRITDYAMRVTDGPRVIKDWRRFAMRLATLEAIGAGGFAALLR
jgi:homoserine kinase type II